MSPQTSIFILCNYYNYNFYFQPYYLYFLINLYFVIFNYFQLFKNLIFSTKIHLSRISNQNSTIFFEKNTQILIILHTFSTKLSHMTSILKTRKIYTLIIRSTNARLEWRGFEAKESNQIRTIKRRNDGGGNEEREWERLMPLKDVSS